MKDTKTKITLPTLHMNGTGPRMLMEGYRAAYDAAGVLMDKIEKIEFNARDYYVQGSEAWITAQGERLARYAAIAAIKEDFMAIMMHDRGRAGPSLRAEGRARSNGRLGRGRRPIMGVASPRRHCQSGGCAMNATIKDGGPAFPRDNAGDNIGNNGMSLRDWFAGQIIAGFGDSPESSKTIAKIAYTQADAMLAERAKLEGAL